MRFTGKELYTFVTADGVSAEVYLFYEIEKKNTMINYEKGRSAFADDIISRSDVYGEETESEAYRIAEQNHVALYERRFDLSRLNPILIPARE